VLHIIRLIRACAGALLIIREDENEREAGEVRWTQKKDDLTARYRWRRGKRRGWTEKGTHTRAIEGAPFV
jgi:hypothetical protein